MTKLRVLELFAGIGTQRMALRNLGINHEVVAIAEIDKYAIKSYEAIHGKTNNLSDVSKIRTEDVPNHDLLTYSFPCQDISLAGKQRGLSENSGTRSSLLWECKRIIEAKKPKYLLMENVKNLVSKKFKADFERWLGELEQLGYTNYYQVLNAKDYGVPQNRERVFCVSILGEHEPYEFPEKQPLTIRLKDILEENVDEKFYLSERVQNNLTVDLKFNTDIKRIGTTLATGAKGTNSRHWVYSDEGVMGTLSATDYKQPKQIGEVVEPKSERIGGIFDKDGKKHQAGAIWDKEQLAPTLDTMQGGWRQPSIIDDIPPLKIKNATKQGYLEAVEGDGVDLAFPDSKARRGRVQKGISQTLDTSGGNSKGVVIAASRGRHPENPSDRTIGLPTKQRLEINKQGVSNTITTVQKDNYVVENYPNIIQRSHGFNKGGTYKESPAITTSSWQENNFSQTQYRIRKLTPKECWRLMGCSDEDFHKAEQVCSNTQLYKQAGNAIVVDVLEGIFESLFNL